MAANGSTPSWRLPLGVTRSLDQYAKAAHIADDYDDYFVGNSLFDFDEAILREHFTRPGLLVDLGCGSGRHCVAFARHGFPVLAVDLSLPMLRVVGEKARREDLPIARIAANMVQLGCLADQSVDYAICMFSTLGMIAGRANRHQALLHIRRMLKPGGLFALHVHNRWRNLYDPQGRRWVVANQLSAWLGSELEAGDKVYDYRGIPNMRLHVFTRRELCRDLRKAGLEIQRVVPLDTARRHALSHPWWLGRLRANGWIVVCQAPR